MTRKERNGTPSAVHPADIRAIRGKNALTARDTVGKRMCVSGTARLSIVTPAKAGIQWPTTHPAEGVLGPGFRRGDDLGRFANSISACLHTTDGAISPRRQPIEAAGRVPIVLLANELYVAAIGHKES